MTKEPPMVSVVTPSYNQGEFIEQTLQSVKNQDYENIEHIVVDGGSTDETIEVLKEYDDKYNLRWISEPDEGQADAVNKGMEMAEGDIIGWVNSDDMYAYPDTLSRVVSTFDTNHDIDVIHGDVLLITDSGEMLRVQSRSTWDSSFFCQGFTICQPSVFLRSHVCEQYQLSTEYEHTADFEYFTRISKEVEFQHVRRVIAVDRIHGDTKRFNEPEVMAQETKDIISKECPDADKSLDRTLVDILRLGGLRIDGCLRSLLLDRDNLLFEESYSPFSILKSTYKLDYFTN